MVATQLDIHIRRIQKVIKLDQDIYTDVNLHDLRFGNNFLTKEK